MITPNMTKNIRILARVVVRRDDRVLLVRNKGAKFWYPPGGGWEYEKETIQQCAVREVYEETGYSIGVNRMLWLQEFHEGDKIFFETFWLAHLSDSNQQDERKLRDHIDHDPEGMVEEAKWFTEDELKDLTVFPARVKDFSLSNNLAEIDPFIGSFL